MGKKLVSAVVAVAALGIPAPAAHADHDAVRCTRHAVSYDPATGAGTFEGVVYGYATGSPGETVRLECYVMVDGVVVATTGVAEGTGTAVVASRLTYRSTETQFSVLCARAYTTRHGWKESCYLAGWDPEWLTAAGWEARRLVDWALRYTFDTAGHLVVVYVDPVVCAVLAANPGYHGPVSIDPQGDVYVDGSLWWDCPPYQPWWAAAAGAGR